MKKRVAILIQTQRGYGRGLLRGVISYLQSNGSWSVAHDDRILGESIPSWLQTWTGDGVLASFESPELVQIVLERKLPAVDVHGQPFARPLPLVRPDDLRAVQAAYRHLQDMGITRFAYCGFRELSFSAVRQTHLRELTDRDGRPLHIHDCEFPNVHDAPRYEADAFLDQESLIEWLVALPKPIGVIACNDIRGAQVLEAAAQASFRVPDEIAVVGIDNDRIVCELCDPPLTSVDLNVEKIGYRAADILDGMMSGRDIASKGSLTVSPAGVVERASSNRIAIRDSVVARALSLIHQQGGSGISVSDVAVQVGVSRSTLERRFTVARRRSIKDEIDSVRLQRLESLLVATDYTLDRLAHLLGFSQAESMSRFFKRATGTTPGEYRRVRQQNAE
jgi:LacI family transcriptional regulator